jgi:hypothetical protein
VKVLVTVSIIIRRYTDHIKFSACILFSLSHSFIFFWFYFLYHCIYGCMFCVLLFNSVNCVLLLLCLCILTVMSVPFVYSVSICCSVYCLCVNVYCTAATGRQPNCGQQIYHIISYISYDVSFHIISSYIILFIFYHKRRDRRGGPTHLLGGPTHPLFTSPPGSFSEVKRVGCQVIHSLPFKDEVKNAWIYTSTPLYAFVT